MVTDDNPQSIWKQAAAAFPPVSPPSSRLCRDPRGEIDVWKTVLESPRFGRATRAPPFLSGENG